MDCLFCKIVAGEIPSDKVLETDLTFAFRDLHPQAPTHVLVVPKTHIDDAAAVEAGDAAVIAEMLTTARQVARLDGIADGGYRLVFNVGDDAGNTVGHLHLHVLGGRQLGWPPYPR